MDLNAIKAKLDTLNSNGQQKEKTDYSKIFWKPELGKQTIRIVPSAYDPAFPFKELKFHYGVGKYPMVALSNFGKQDPIEEFVKELRKTSDKDNWSLSGKLNPKTRVFAPVVVRGEEDKGVRFYEFGKMVYQEFLGVMADEDYGDITDIQKGRDITVEVIPAAETGKMFNTTTIRVKPNQTPLVEDATKAEGLLENQKELVSLFKKYTFDEMKDELQGWLKPSDEDGGKQTEVKAAPSKQKENIDSKLDQLFD
jgi:hypothetical protein